MHDPVVVFQAPLHIHATAPEIDGHVAIQQKVVAKVALDDVTLVAESDDKLFLAVVSVVFEDVPEDRLSADLNHRLRNNFRFFSQSGSTTASKDHHSHRACW